MSSISTITKRVFPFLGWVKELNGYTFRADFVAGVTVALVLIPQSMAYAQLAGLPAHYGLYAAFLPPMVASLFGSSRQLATGPVAVVSLMTATALEPFAVAGSEQFIMYAILLALMVGIFQFLLGVFRLGLVVNFLSHPVVNGFTCAAALIIATSQLPKIFGVEVEKAEHHYQTVLRVLASAFHNTHLPTFGMAVLAFATLILLKKLNPKIPNVLVAVALTTLLSAVFGFKKDAVTSIDRIHSPDVTSCIHEYNHALNQLEQIQLLRAAEGQSLMFVRSSISASDDSICSRCHSARDIDMFRETGPREMSAPPGSAAALHCEAGLVDLLAEQIKAQSSDCRTRLRNFRLVSVANEDGSADFYPKAQAPPGSPPGAATWQIRVHDREIAPDRIQIRAGGAVVGDIPRGLPAVRLPALKENLQVMFQLIPAAIVISILGFMEAISIAKAMAARTRQRLDPDQELIGQGLANIIGCCAQSYACSGSFSRSAVNLQAGAMTGFSNVISSGVVVIVLLFLTPLLYYLPQAVLAAIIMMAVVSLFNVSGFVHAWRVQKLDGITGVITFAATLLLAPHLEWGLLIGVLISLGGYLHRTMRPSVVVLSPHPDGSLRDARRHALPRCRHLAVLRFVGPLNFASVNYLEEKILEELAATPELRHVLIDGHGINEIDASGDEMLRHLVRQLRASGQNVSFSGMNESVLDTMRQAHLYDIIGPNRFFATLAQAVTAVYPITHAESNEVTCPFRTIMPRVTEVSLHADGALRNADLHGLRRCRYIVALRFDQPVNYTNASFLEEEVLKMLSTRPDARHVLFAAPGITEIDEEGAHKLVQLVERLRNEHFAVSFCSFNDEVSDFLHCTGAAERIGMEHIFPTQILAINGIYADAHVHSSEQDCPFLPLMPRLVDLSMHPDGSLRDAQRYDLALCRYIAAVRIDGALRSGSINYLTRELQDRLRSRPDVTHVLIAAHRITEVDEQSAHGLGALVALLRSESYEVVFSGLRDDVVAVLCETSTYDIIGHECSYPTQAQAVETIHARAHDGRAKERCPLLTVVHSIEEPDDVLASN